MIDSASHWYLMLLVLTLSACTNIDSDLGKPRAGRVQGRLVMAGDEPPRLPENAVLRVSLADVSRADAPADVLARVDYVEFSFPLKYSLPYDPALIVDSHSYAMSAQVRDPQGRLHYTSDTYHPVLTQGHGERANLTLVPVDR